MGVIYCNSCEIGVHYIDRCRGGKNGVPRLSDKQIKRAEIFERIMWTMFAIALALVPFCFIGMALLAIKGESK